MAGYIKSAGWEIDAETGDRHFLVVLEFNAPPEGFTLGDVWNAAPVEIVRVEIAEPKKSRHEINDRH